MVPVTGRKFQQYVDESKEANLEQMCKKLNEDWSDFGMLNLLKKKNYSENL